MRGQQICHFHGGKNPTALRAARERLLALAEPALDGLLHALESNDLPAIVSAARVVLDRAGLGPHATVTLNRGVELTGLEDLSPDELVQELESLLADARRLAGREPEHKTLRIVTTNEPDREGVELLDPANERAPETPPRLQHGYTGSRND